jgi:hypothetical protein
MGLAAGSTRSVAMGNSMQYWEIWYPKAGATGLLVGRGMLDSTEIVALHAAPDVITVEVADQEGNRVAVGEELQRTGDSPMCFLRRQNGTIVREDNWPADRDLKVPVMLPGGEVGTLESWWHSEDKKEWRWNVEFYNSARDEEKDTWAR